MLSGQSMGTSQKKLIHNLSLNAQPQLSELAEPLRADPGLESGLDVCKLTSTEKRKERKGKLV